MSIPTAMHSRSIHTVSYTHLKVDLPTFGSPRMPSFITLFLFSGNVPFYYKQSRALSLIHICNHMGVTDLTMAIKEAENANPGAVAPVSYTHLPHAPCRPAGCLRRWLHSQAGFGQCCSSRSARQIIREAVQQPL